MKQVGNIYVIAAVAVLGGGLLLLQPRPRRPSVYRQAELHKADIHGAGGITAAMAAVSWLAALISGLLSNQLARKTSIMIGCLIGTVFWVVGPTLICASQNIGMLIVGRIINGLSVGTNPPMCPCISVLQRGHVPPCVLHLPRNRVQDPEGDRVDVRGPERDPVRGHAHLESPRPDPEDDRHGDGDLEATKAHNRVPVEDEPAARSSTAETTTEKTAEWPTASA
ncbi:general substrate transporter [Penicillium riverlandense]|uniref:general substrate transporter n=1 Tax=Penicillium riverlandense TaxID=1903569 RepID=UPI0025484571|nr:general substrate transporter [Penicillium riverlandense]KAJ5826448.1 general substrate transporter [Penicillium riverlandense]